MHPCVCARACVCEAGCVRFGLVGVIANVAANATANACTYFLFSSLPIHMDAPKSVAQPTELETKQQIDDAKRYMQIWCAIVSVESLSGLAIEQFGNQPIKQCVRYFLNLIRRQNANPNRITSGPNDAKRPPAIA